MKCRSGDSIAPAATAAPPRARRPWRWLRLGIAWQLGIGLTAVATVLVVGELLATRTTREALAAVRSMQTEHEPLADRANTVLERLLAYDRTIAEYLQAHSPEDSRRPQEPRGPEDLRGITAAGDALQSAVADYFSSSPASVTSAAAGLRLQLTRHIATARELASRAAERTGWDAERRTALDQVYRRVVSAGGRGAADRSPPQDPPAPPAQL